MKASFLPCNSGVSVVITNSAMETQNLGEELGKVLKKGSIVALSGGLGAGKTCLCRGICRALGVEERVTSPTYTIIHEYEGILPVYHIDAYRLSGADDFEAMGGTEILESPGGVCVIEWSDRIGESLPSGTVYVQINILAGERREIRVRF
jgi:tRNA threonylcarbamoyladenosine biosynthesis protein TsaE